MLRIVIEEQENFNEEDQTFSMIPGAVLDLEHSLVSLSKWESKHAKPFLSSESKTPEEMFNYLEMMVLNQDMDLRALHGLTEESIIAIQNYIDSPQSATTFGSMPERRGRGETITAELIYYWMVAFNIPFECQYWHLNRLFALVRICNIKSQPPKKMSKHEIALRNRELNEQRRKQLGTKG